MAVESRSGFDSTRNWMGIVSGLVVAAHQENPGLLEGLHYSGNNTAGLAHTLEGEDSKQANVEYLQVLAEFFARKTGLGTHPLNDSLAPASEITL